MPKILHCVAAAIDDGEGNILLGQRPADKIYPGLYEFPGGKLEPNETPEDALVRELEEELAIKVDKASLKPLTFASFTYPEFHLVMPLYHVTKWSGKVEPQENQAVVWVKRDELQTYTDKVPGANIPLLNFVQNLN